MKSLFGIFILLIIYCYFGYPLLLSWVAKLRSRPVLKKESFPAISIVISVCDEEDVIEAKLKNITALDYPVEKIEVLIGSDGSQDKTNDIVKNFVGDLVLFVAKPKREGKPAMLNHLVSMAKNEIIIFADARQMFDAKAVRELVANFADPAVGCVSGELIFFNNEEEGTGKGVNLYWNYEKYLRNLESRIHSMLGATGAIYAIRRKLYEPVPATIVLDDMYTPLKIIQKGYRAIFDGAAQAFDKVATKAKEEHTRKVRTLFGNYQIFCLMPNLFNPWQSPIAIQLFSHKFLRLMIPFFMIGTFILNWFLLEDFLFRFILLIQIIFYGMAVTGALAGIKKYGMLRPLLRVCYIPYVFCLLNFSALIGFIRFLRSNQEIAWQKARKIT